MNEIILLQSDSFTGTNNKRKNSFAPDVWLRSSVGRPSRYLNWARMGLGSNGTGFEFCRSLSLFFSRLLFCNFLNYTLPAIISLFVYHPQVKDNLFH